MRYLKTTFLLLLASLFFWTCDENGIIQSTFVDPRDGRTYESIRVGSTVWMAEDLQFNDSSDFSYQQSLDACPPGWSVPAEEDWVKLCEYFGGYVYDGEAIGNPQQAYDRMVRDFNARGTGFYWTSTPAWIDVPMIRSSVFTFTGETVEYGAILVSFKLGCRCIKREKEETGDVIEFKANGGNQERYDFHSFRNSEYQDGIYFIVHRRVEGNVLVDRVAIVGKLPGKMIGEGDPAVEGTQTSIHNFFNNKSPFEGGGWTLSTGEGLDLNFTYYDGKRVRGTFSGTTDNGDGIDEGFFDLFLE